MQYYRIVINVTRDDRVSKNASDARYHIGDTKA